MVKNILFSLLGLFMLLLFMGIHVIQKVARSDEFSALLSPPDVLAEPIAAPLSPIRAVSLNGQDTIELDLRDETAFVNLWATWCKPCIMEMPHIEKLYQAHKEKMEFYIISTDKKLGQARAFINRKGYTFPVYHLLRTPQTGHLASSLPLTLLSHNSKLVIRHTGAANWNSEPVHQLIEKLAGSQNPTDGS